ncbi:MAG: hypothetical protein HOV81_02345 [Kofleriaceae bacterium]|nr:hypothetical protein [Kofleriaceae bacterium]
MRRLLVAALALCACTDDPPKDILDQLAALPDVTVTEWTPPADFMAAPGYRFFDLTFTQPIDHDNPSAGTFVQHGSLMHKDADAPLVFYTSGYGAGRLRSLSEPASLLAANQLSLEYRFYDESRTDDVDWSKLTVHQNVEDEHAILGKLGGIYHGATIQTGGSKGGENSLFHLWLHPEDLDGVVAYVAPVITDHPDQRYATVVDDIGTESCRASLRAAAREMLVRRAAMEQRASEMTTYDIVGVAHATETAIVELEFSFWMTRGEADCGDVPPTTATDDELFEFLARTGGPAAYGDADLLEYGQQYLYQDYKELGYPVWQHAYLDDLMQFSYEDWSAYLPAPVPDYDPAMPRGLADWLATGPDRILFIGGQWDPWGAGYPAIPTDDETLVYSVEHGSHWSSGIYSLTPAERTTAIAALKKWANVASTRELVAPTGTMATPYADRWQRR